MEGPLVCEFAAETGLNGVGMPVTDPSSREQDLTAAAMGVTFLSVSSLTTQHIERPDKSRI